MGDYEALEAAIIPKKTRVLISESPTNPYLRVADLEKAGRDWQEAQGADAD